MQPSLPLSLDLEQAIAYVTRLNVCIHKSRISCTRREGSKLPLSTVSTLATTGLTTPWRTGSCPNQRSASGRTAARTGPATRLPGGSAETAATEGPWCTGWAPTHRNAVGKTTGADWMNPGSAGWTNPGSAGSRSPGSAGLKIHIQNWRCRPS
jgi:hypothetical protein